MNIKSLLTLITTMVCAVSSAQIIDDRTNDITLFHEYQPATVTLTSGNLNRQRQANIFLKGSTFVYKQGKNVMEAKMSMIKSVKFGDREFMNMGTKLGEVVYTYGGAQILCVRTINIDGLKNEMLNSSTITDLSMTSDQMGITRVDLPEDQLMYPVDTDYYYYLDGKYIICDYREVKRAAGKKRIDIFESIVKGYDFHWTSLDSLKQLLQALSDPIGH